MVSDTYDYWNMVENIIPACKKEIMEHNGKLLIRPDSGDMVDISIRTIEKLWETFGGTVNSKGYKVLDPHIGLIYGDGCTLNRVAEIYDILQQRGFAANNVVFGVGAFCFHMLPGFEKSTIITRDTFGMAMKATYGEFGDKKLFIYKDPKTDEGNLKKSHKGCCCVLRPDGTVAHLCRDQYKEWVPDEYTMLKTVFKDGKITRFDSFTDIRRRMYG
jgi:nicotinamide phosphoribosyltransferase